ncbi:hypothetical protein GCM10010381_55030 [Streptomyces xantholiticus]|nr:hypothetical protein GCM10010381_55030 [Streptomyces xantholiticus]
MWFRPPVDQVDAGGGCSPGVRFQFPRLAAGGFLGVVVLAVDPVAVDGADDVRVAVRGSGQCLRQVDDRVDRRPRLAGALRVEGARQQGVEWIFLTDPLGSVRRITD